MAQTTAMQIALCNEVIAGHASIGKEFAAQCAFAAELGYAGLEVAPFTLGEEPHLLSATARTELRRAAADAGIAITGLHWLMITPKGLSITSADAPTRARTRDVIERLIGLCADLGGSVLVHGSPAQRRLSDATDPASARGHALALFQRAAEMAAAHKVIYCVEPLAAPEADFINTVEEAVAIVDEINNPAFRTMIDTSAAGNSEQQSVADLIRHWLPSGKIAHIQLNDSNRRAPGQGQDDFVAILSALREVGYDRVAAVEPFDYRPDGPTTAAFAIGYLRGILDSF